MLKSFAEAIKCVCKPSGVLCYVGKHSMPILCLHVVSFKIISWIYIKTTGASSVLLAGFNVTFDAREFSKLLSTITGIGIPLLLY